VLGPRRAAAKTLVKGALAAATSAVEGIDPQAALAEALSALDRAAKSGAIHKNAAARRKSRLTLKVNDLVGGGATAAAGRVKTVGKAAAQKAAKARIAAGKAGKAKGAQTAAGKARAALTRTSRSDGGEKAAESGTARPAAVASAKAPAKKAPARKTAAKATAKPATKAASKKS
jgi:ribosomal protein S20